MAKDNYKNTVARRNSISDLARLQPSYEYIHTDKKILTVALMI